MYFTTSLRFFRHAYANESLILRFLVSVIFKTCNITFLNTNPYVFMFVVVFLKKRVHIFVFVMTNNDYVYNILQIVIRQY